jgi:hypothetical protein
VIAEKSAVKSDEVNFAPAVFCLGLVLANHSIFRLGSLPLLWSAALILTVAAVAVLAPTIEFKSRCVSSLRPVNLLVGLVLLAPLAAARGEAYVSYKAGTKLRARSQTN